MDRPDFYNVNLDLICKLFERDADAPTRTPLRARILSNPF